MKPWQTSLNKSTWLRRTKDRWPKLETEEQNPNWFTKGQRNKSCSRAPLLQTHCNIHFKFIHRPLPPNNSSIALQHLWWVSNHPMIFLVAKVFANFLKFFLKNFFCKNIFFFHQVGILQFCKNKKNWKRKFTGFQMEKRKTPALLSIWLCKNTFHVQV
jgi:hypothetical protein